MSVDELSVNAGFEIGYACENALLLEQTQDLAGLALHEVLHAPSLHRFFYPTYEFRASSPISGANTIQKKFRRFQ